MSKRYAVIMAGGKGERFWPLSTSRTPKQVLSLIGEKPLIEMAVDFLGDLVPPENVLVITSAELTEPIADALHNVPRENIIGEPFGRDTAAVCALAAAITRKRGGDDASFCILTADHVIDGLPCFRQTLSDAFSVAENNDVLVTIGIQPDHPSTGFGYIEAAEPFKATGTSEFFEARRFVEKPDAATAAKYLAAGNYYWNAGMFVWSAAAILRALERFQPQLSALAVELTKNIDTPEFADALETAYSRLEKISIDYAIMEKADNILMVRGTFEWDDVGSWTALERHFAADKQNNVLVGKCEELDSHENIVYSKNRLTALIGVENMIVVQTGDVTLVCPKDRAQDIKQMVQMLRKKGGYEDVL